MTRIALFVVCTAAAGQVTANGQLQFDVASVKPIPPSPGFHKTVLNISHGRFKANFAAPRQIAGVAYNIQRVRVTGGSGLDGFRFV